MKNISLLLFVLVSLISSIVFLAFTPDWGFFGHRRINRLAVFTLEPSLGMFYKKNLDFITEHAVDPDKRRYAAKHEAVRHYIDIDHWGVYPFEDLPRDKDEAVLLHGSMRLITIAGDTLSILKEEELNQGSDHLFISGSNFVWKEQLLPAYRTYLSDQYYKDQKWVKKQDLHHFFKDIDTSQYQYLEFIDDFSEYGVLPYFLEEYYMQLVKAFATKNVKRILRISAEIGHYIGDACVPLHTTENYNGQLTNQNGIHAFWESRIPELFAENEFDVLSGRARYIVDPKQYFWGIILESHSLCGDVLEIEKELSRSFPDDQQFCYVERLERTIRTQCEDYAKTYSTSLNGMVEDRWHRAIMAIGSVWYSAWLDAGSPDLDINTSVEEDENDRKIEAQFQTGKPLGRVHQNF